MYDELAPREGLVKAVQEKGSILQKRSFRETAVAATHEEANRAHKLLEILRERLVLVLVSKSEPANTIDKTTPPPLDGATPLTELDEQFLEAYQNMRSVAAALGNLVRQISL